MSCDESINTDDGLPTPGNISQQDQVRPWLGVKVSTSTSGDYRPWRSGEWREISHQTTKQANIIVIIKQPQPGPVRPGQPGEGRFLFFFCFRNFEVYGGQNNPSLDWQFCNFLCDSSLLTLKSIFTKNNLI